MKAVYDTTIVGKRYNLPENELLSRNLCPVDYHEPLKKGEGIRITIHETGGDVVYDLLVEYIEPFKGTGSLPKVILRCTNLLSQAEQLDNIKGGLLNRKL